MLNSSTYNDDCMSGMIQFPDKFFDLAVVDPPYGISAPEMSMGQNLSRSDGWRREEGTAVRIKQGRLNHGTGKLKNRMLNSMNCNWDYEKPGIEYFNELFRISKQQIIWGGNYFELPPTRCVICWDKRQPWNNFSQWEMGWTSFDKPAALFSFSNTGGLNAEKKIHPTQKPVALYAWVFRNYAGQGDKILDTHLGSQSSRIAAYKLGFDFWGWEIDKDYFDAGNDRFKKAIAMPLFNDVKEIQLQIF